MLDIKIGDTLTCAETGKTFVAQQEGCTFNYARDDDGNVYSDEGVDIRLRRELLDRSKPFVCYLSSDGKHVTGWKGNVLGAVTQSTTIKLARWSYMHGKTMQSVRVRDIHGGLWFGRSSPGMCVTLRPSKRGA